MAVRAGIKEATSQLGDFGQSLKFLCLCGLRSERPARSHGGACALTLVAGEGLRLGGRDGRGWSRPAETTERPLPGMPGGAGSLGLTPTPQHSISVALTLRRHSGGRSPARLTKGQGTPGSCPSCCPPSTAADGGVPAWPPGSLLGQQLRNPVLGQMSKQHVSAGGHPQVPGPEEQAILWDKWADVGWRCTRGLHAGHWPRPGATLPAAGCSPLALSPHHPGHPLTRVAPTQPVTRASWRTSPLLQDPVLSAPYLSHSMGQPLPAGPSSRPHPGA